MCLSSRSSVRVHAQTRTSLRALELDIIIFTPGLNVKSYQPIRFFYD